MVFVNSSVGEDKDICTLAESLVNFNEQSLNSLCKSCVLIVENGNTTLKPAFSYS